ncbi:unnamed protein product, partial [Menidia menidia]
RRRGVCNTGIGFPPCACALHTYYRPVQGDSESKPFLDPTVTSLAW